MSTFVGILRERQKIACWGRRNEKPVRPHSIWGGVVVGVHDDRKKLLLGVGVGVSLSYLGVVEKPPSHFQSSACRFVCLEKKVYR